MAREKRKYRRLPIRARAMIKSRWQLIGVDCVDASVAGFHIHSDGDFAVGDQVEMALDLPDGERVYCDGQVVREDAGRSRPSAGHGYGIQIVGVGKDAHQKLRNWLEIAIRSGSSRRTPDDSPGLDAFLGALKQSDA